MSHQLGRVVSEILHRYFGEIVQKVGNDLFTFGSKPISMITKSTGLPRSQVIESLRSLLKYDLATFEPSHNEVVADYKLNPDNVLLLIRYPRYLLEMKTKYGCVAELIVEELLQQGICSVTELIVTIANKYKDDKEKDITIVSLRDTFVSLATAGYVQQAPAPAPPPADTGMPTPVPVPTLVPVATIVPELDARALAHAAACPADINDNVYWRVNFDRFHQDFRDDVMIKAISSRIDENAGELMRQLLQQMYLSSAPWVAEGAPCGAGALRDAALRLAAERPLLHQYIDQYLKVLEEEGCGFVRRRGEAAGGRYAVCARRAAAACLRELLERLLTERLGSDAARIFRVICANKYIEEENIQKHAMLANKECKELTYKLLEEHFITVQPMRKAASAGGLAKTIYLYHVDIHEARSQAAHAAAELCARALHNGVRRGARARAAAQRLLDKQRRVRTVVHGMRARGEPQRNIDDVEETLTPPELAQIQEVERKLKQLSAAELELDKDLFIINWYFMYPR